MMTNTRNDVRDGTERSFLEYILFRLEIVFYDD